MENEICGLLVIHQHDKDNWKLRNLEKHPIDPNWETGTYCKCHEKLRFSRLIKKGLIIFDTIWLSRRSYPYVRSAFPIKSRDHEKLTYDYYYFADGDWPFEITPSIIPKIKSGPYPTNPGIKLSKENCKKLLLFMKKNSYHKYKSGEKPVSISESDWRKMKTEAKKSMSKHHRCGLDKHYFIPIESIR